MGLDLYDQLVLRQHFVEVGLGERRRKWFLWTHQQSHLRHILFLDLIHFRGHTEKVFANWRLEQVLFVGTGAHNGPDVGCDLIEFILHIIVIILLLHGGNLAKHALSFVESP